MARSLSGFQTWVKPLSSKPDIDTGITDGKEERKSSISSYFVVLLNTNDENSVDIPVTALDNERATVNPSQMFMWDFSLVLSLTSAGGVR
jgi:hypothetical protein